MGKVVKICIADDHGKKMKSVKEVQAVAGKGLINDRHFRNDNKNKNQITLIENENIDYYNKITGTSISQENFRRNIVTQNIKLNDLVGKEFFIGDIKLKAHDLCRPCKYLQETLNQENTIKELLLKGGLRCEILKDGKIIIDDEIKL